MAYDDFEDGTIDKWTPTATSGGSMAASTSAKKYGNYGARITTDGQNDHTNIYYENTEINTTSANLYFWVRSSNVEYAIMKYYVFDNTGDFVGVTGIDRGNLYYQSAEGKVNFSTTPQNNTWYRIRMVYDNPDLSFYLYDADNELLESVTGLTRMGLGTTAVKILLASFDYYTEVIYIDFDNVCYTDTAEPTVTGQYMTGLKYW